MGKAPEYLLAMQTVAQFQTKALLNYSILVFNGRSIK